MDDQNLQATANHASRPGISKVTTEQGAQQLALLAREIWEEHYTPLIGAQQVAYILTRYQSAEQIWLTVNKGNLGSITVYQAMGFHQDEAIVTDIGDGFVMDDYVMRLELGDDRIKAEIDKESSI